jgi:Fe-S-cluster containining protein
MSLYRKVQAVRRVFDQLEKETNKLKSETGLHCKSSCGHCCYNPTISATILEFLPFAYDMFREGRAEEILSRVDADPENTGCINLKKLSYFEGAGHCENYTGRGLICRLFGFAAMLDKNGNPALVTCKIMKNDPELGYHKTVDFIGKGGKIPVFRNYYTKIRFIDPSLGTELIPINKAIEMALKYVLNYYSYRRPRKAG